MTPTPGYDRLGRIAAYDRLDLAGGGGLTH
jgi:hypothetical protein